MSQVGRFTCKTQSQSRKNKTISSHHKDIKTEKQYVYLYVCFPELLNLKICHDIQMAYSCTKNNSCSST
jgi:hypothetical protein